MPEDSPSQSQLTLYQTEDNRTRIEVRLEGGTVWLTQANLAKLPNMGLTTWKGAKVRKADVSIAKNYLGEDELKKLSLIVTQYLDFAELQAMERRLMHMRDWIAKLDGFLRLSDQEILENAGSISAEDAKRKAEREFEKFDQQRRQIEDAKAEETFAADVDALASKAKQLGAPKPPGRKKE